MTCHSFNCFSTVLGSGKRTIGDFWLLCFSSCYFRGELSNAYIKNSGPALLKGTRHTSPKSTVTRSRRRFKALPVIREKCNHHGLFIPQRTFPRVLCIGKCTFPHFSVSSLNMGKKGHCGIYLEGRGRGGLMCGRHLLNNNYKYYSDFFMGVNLFLALSSIVFLEQRPLSILVWNDKSLCWSIFSPLNHPKTHKRFMCYSFHLTCSHESSYDINCRQAIGTH